MKLCSVLCLHVACFVLGLNRALAFLLLSAFFSFPLLLVSVGLSFDLGLYGALHCSRPLALQCCWLLEAVGYFGLRFALYGNFFVFGISGAFLCFGLHGHSFLLGLRGALYCCLPLWHIQLLVSQVTAHCVWPL